MTLVRSATLFCAMGLLVASAVHAGVPYSALSDQPGNFGVPAVVKVVGHGSTPDPAGNVTYIIRDASNAIVPSSVILLNFTACTDVRLCGQNIVTPGIFVNCPAHIVTATSNSTGGVTFAICGTGTGPGPAVLVPTKCVTVTADGKPMNDLVAATADYDGLTVPGGVNSLDLGFTGSDVNASGTKRARSDFDANGAVNSLDLGIEAAVVNASGSIGSCTGADLCP